MVDIVVLYKVLVHIVAVVGRPPGRAAGHVRSFPYLHTLPPPLAQQHTLEEGELHVNILVPRTCVANGAGRVCS